MIIQSTQASNRRFFVSLLLIIVSFALLFLIALNSLRTQEQLLTGRSRDEKLNRIDRISSDFFLKLKDSELETSAIRLPFARPAFPGLLAPQSRQAGLFFLQMAIEKDSRAAHLIQAELESPDHEADFWRKLLLQEYISSENFFELRRVATRILESSFDYLTDDGLPLKNFAVIKVADSFLLQNNPEAAKEWVKRLYQMPAPAVIPVDIQNWFKAPLPEDLRDTLQLLQNCWKLSYAENIKPGWHGPNNASPLVIKAGDQLFALSAGQIIQALHQRFAGSGFADIPVAVLQSDSGDSHVLAGSDGLMINLPAGPPAAVPGGFLALIFLTSLGIFGLFLFALHEWQMLQKARLLDEEEQFFRQTAHDLKTPVTTVSFLAETLALKRYRNEEQQQKYLEQLQTESQKASELFDRLLLSVRLRKNTVKADIKPVNASEMLKSILLRFRTRMSDWEICEQYSGNDSIPADPDMLERVFINLIENVLRHASESRNLTIETTEVTGAAGSAVRIRIGDRGKGFSGLAEADEHDLMSSPLPYSPERGGSGTGLFLVRQIMQTHGGTLRAEKREGGGLWMVTTWRTEKSGR